MDKINIYLAQTFSNPSSGIQVGKICQASEGLHLRLMAYKKTQNSTLMFSEVFENTNTNSFDKIRIVKECFKVFLITFQC